MKPPHAVAGECHASPLQQYLWRRQSETGRVALASGCAVDMEGEVDLERLTRAVHTVALRHLLVWTRVVDPADGRQLAPESSIAMLVSPAVGDAPSLPDVLHDLDAADGLRATLYCTSREARSHRLILTLPALRGDEASVCLFASEICREYIGEPIASEPPAFQYGDLTEWLHGLAEQQESRDDREWWQKQAAAALPPRLAAGGSVARGAFAPRRACTWLPGEVVEQLDRAAASFAVPLSALLLVAWRELVARVARRTPHLLGVTFDGRSYDMLDDVVGPFERVTPLACTSLRGSTAADAVRDTAALVAAGAERQEYCPPDLSACVPDQFACAEVRRLPSGEHVRFRIADLWSIPDRFRIRCVFRRSDGRVACDVAYDAASISDTAAAAIARSLETLCAAIGRNDGVRLSAVPLVRADRPARAASPAAPRGGTLGPQTVTEMIQRHTRERPAQVAVADDAEIVTYGELGRRAAGVATALRDRGIGPGCVVGVCVDRSIDAVAALLGILYAGAAYAPLDTRAPAERQRRLQAALGSPWLVATSAAGRLLGHDPSTTLALETCAPVESAPEERPAHPRELFSIVFTSGSSGEPKGVAVEHGNMTAYLRALDARLGIAGASFASMSTLAADLGNTAVFGALAFGGTLLLPSYEALLDPDALSQYFAAHPCDCMKIVPGHAAALLAHDRAGAILPGRYLICGGEVLPADLVRRVRELRPACTIVNHYGPTECTVGAIAERVEECGAAGPALGRPLEGSEIYLVDEALNLVPHGLPGEICIGGPQVARGYWHSAAATAERFLPNPWTEAPGDRIYRTGDLGIVRSDGRVEFLGRIDEEVKIAGFRVDPAEVAAVLSQHPDVNDAVVLAGDAHRTRGLVAFAVAGPGGASASALRSYLRERLPPHMVPRIACVSTLPRNTNGKIDREALMRLEDDGSGGSIGQAPASEVERTIADVWCAALGRPAVSVDENFFDAGGHSLMLIQIHATLQERLGRKVSIPTLFEYPTVRELARFVASEDVENTLADVAGRARARSEARARRDSRRNDRSAHVSRDAGERP